MYFLIFNKNLQIAIQLLAGQAILLHNLVLQRDTTLIFLHIYSVIMTYIQPTILALKSLF